MDSARVIRAILAALVALAAAPAAVVALDELGEHDVPTFFYVSKSDDRNRVDYGIRLDAACRPTRDDPVFAYWRRFEPGEPRFGDLNILDQQAYGITRQRVARSDEDGTWVELGIRAVPEPLLVRVAREERGAGCSVRARMELNGRSTWIDRAHVQLAGPMAVESITFYGADVETGEPVRCRRRP